MATAVEQAIVRDESDGRESLTVPAQAIPDADFERFFLEHYGRVVAVLVRMTGDRSQAEELAIDVFWKYCRQPAHAIAPPDKLNAAGWLYRTATRMGIDRLRAEARRGKYEQQAASVSRPAGDNPLDQILKDERAARVRRALAELRPVQSQLLVLRATGFSYAELSAAFGVKRGSVGTMLIRAEAALRKRYLRLYGSEEEL